MKFGNSRSGSEIGNRSSGIRSLGYALESIGQF
jgi:hypothetical protein